MNVGSWVRHKLTGVNYVLVFKWWGWGRVACAKPGTPYIVNGQVITPTTVTKKWEFLALLEEVAPLADLPRRAQLLGEL